MYAGLEILIYIVALTILSSPMMGKNWSVCGNGCARRRGHTGGHSDDQSMADLSPSNLKDYRPGTPLMGEIGALHTLTRKDPELGNLLQDAYLKNRQGHKDAQSHIRNLQLKKAAEKAGVY